MGRTEKNICRRPHGSNFTLVELLVVIAVIAILAGMLLPALSRARDVAKRIGCSSILKNFGVWDMAYTQDYNGYGTPFQTDSMNWSSFYNTNYLNRKSGNTASSWQQNNYIELKLRCPATNLTIAGVFATHPGDYWNYIAAAFPYGRNSCYGYWSATGGERLCIRVARIKYPSRRITFGDRMEGITPPGSDPTGSGGLVRALSVERPVGDQHHRSTPLAFQDGRVESVNPYQVNPIGTLPGSVDSSTNKTVVQFTQGSIGSSSPDIKYLWGVNGATAGGDYRYDYP